MMPFTRRIEPGLARFLASTCRGVAVVAAIFCVAVATLLVANYVQMATVKPLESPALEAMREQYRAAPGDDELAGKIRALDLAARRVFFTRQWQNRTAAIVLVAGAAVLVVCLRAASALSKRLPKPLPGRGRDAAAGAAGGTHRADGDGRGAARWTPSWQPSSSTACCRPHPGSAAPAQRRAAAAAARPPRSARSSSPTGRSSAGPGGNGIAVPAGSADRAGTGLRGRTSPGRSRCRCPGTTPPSSGATGSSSREPTRPAARSSAGTRRPARCGGGPRSRREPARLPRGCAITNDTG